MLKLLMSSTNLVTRTIAQFTVVAVAGTVGVTVASTSASASLDAVATNTSAQVISTGTISLTQTNTAGSLGFGYQPPSLVPGDSVNFNVSVTNGTTDTTVMSLSMTDSTPTVLTTDGANGLKVAIADCWNGLTGGSALYGTWSLAGVCSVPSFAAGTSVLATTALSTMNGTANEKAVTGAQTANVVRSLRFTVSLPNLLTETVTNGVNPNPTTTLQGRTANLTWKLHVTQITGQARNG